jgi:hypothetical protein
MPQPAAIVLEKHAQIADAVFQHGQTLNAQAKGKALMARSIQTAGG